MSDSIWSNHMTRMRTGLSAQSHGTICDFITQHTYLAGKRFNFDGHEYQRKILEDGYDDIVILKSAQLGISEMSSRLAVAKTALLRGFNTMYTLPSATAMQKFMKTRIDPLISSSPYLRSLVSKDVNNSMLKQFGDSFLVGSGSAVDTQALSQPIDLLVQDEVDNSNPNVLTLFESRLIHSKYKQIVRLSTPTIPNYGIDAFYRRSRRNMAFVKCCHCNHWFYPEYYDHVKIPDFTASLESITKQHFADPQFRWQEAAVCCPACGKPVDLSAEHRNWVCENPDDKFISVGYRVSPFDCPHNITAADLVAASVRYARRQDFFNQRIGLPMEDSESSLSMSELQQNIISDASYSRLTCVMGLDMGNTCYATIAAVLPDGVLVILHTEGIPMHTVVERRKQLERKYNVRMTVVDLNPFGETVWRMQQDSPNVFAGVYTRSKSVELFKVRDQQADAEQAKVAVRQVNISRDRVFDLIMMLLRNKLILKVSDDMDVTWAQHLTDQKRVREFDNDELVFVWRKTSGNDHLHHSLLYALIASKMIGVASGCRVALPLVSSFKVQQNLT